jgi:hypothetical protein
MSITRLEDARTLKQMHMPLNMPVEERTFSPGYSKHWADLMNAHGAFVIALNEYVDGARAVSPGKWRLVKRRLMALDRAAVRCAEFAGSQQDEPERALMAFFLQGRAAPFIQYWAEAIDAVDDGASLTIRPGDVPKWFD